MSLHTVKNHLSTIYAKLGVYKNIDAFRVVGWLKIPEEL